MTGRLLQKLYMIYKNWLLKRDIQYAKILIEGQGVQKRFIRNT